MRNIKFTGILAVASDNVIGYDGGIPWPRLKGDMKHFREVTDGHIVVMGRKTWESIGRVLPGRFNLAITRDSQKLARFVDDNFAAQSFESFILNVDIWGLGNWPEEVFVIGGAEILNLFSGLIDKYIVTRVDWNLPLDSDPNLVVRWSGPCEGGWSTSLEYKQFEKANEEEPNSFLVEYNRVKE